ncbi:MAG: FHA domain-containing protein, partial [Planctomycetota bacterium]
MKVYLDVVAGPYQGEHFKAYVTSGVKTTIGRAPDNDIAFPATPTVSNHHAYLTNQNGVLVLIDNGS